MSEFSLECPIPTGEGRSPEGEQPIQDCPLARIVRAVQGKERLDFGAWDNLVRKIEETQKHQADMRATFQEQLLVLWEIGKRNKVLGVLAVLNILLPAATLTLNFIKR